MGVGNERLIEGRATHVHDSQGPSVEVERLPLQRVEGLFRHPLKSAHAEELEEMDIELSGPLGDRGWALKAPNGKFVSQRTDEGARLALVRATVNEKGNLVLNAPGMPQIEIPKKPRVRGLTTLEMWKKPVTTIYNGAVKDKGTKWLMKFLGLKGDYKLVNLSDEYPRKLSQTWINKPEGTVTLADGYPVLLMNEASLVNLNEHLPEGKKVNRDRFRSNIVVTGFEAWEEDLWEVIQIGEVIFDVVKPCSRCKIVTRDADTGEIPDLGEPLKTLMQMRNEEVVAASAGTDKFIDAKGGYFGWNLVPRNKGKISRNDRVVVLKQRQRKAA